MPDAKPRIWYQSFSDLSSLPEYLASLKARTSRAAGPTTDVSVVGMQPGTYGAGDEARPPLDYVRFLYLKYLNEAQIIDNALEAERVGFGAFVIGCFHDPGLQQARSLVSIPIVGMAEAAMFTASSFGRRFGVITTTPAFAYYTEELAREYGIAERLAAVEVMDDEITEFELDVADQIRDRLERSLESAAARLIRSGAEVLIIGDGNLNEATATLGLRRLASAPVVDVVACAVKVAVCHMELNREFGLSTSRVGLYATPDPANLERARDFESRRRAELSSRPKPGPDLRNG